MRVVKSAIKALFSSAGLHVEWKSPSGHLRARDIFQDMKVLIPDARTIFDVGANIGQSTLEMRKVYPQCDVHAFEPDRRAMETAQARLAEYSGITLNQMALSDKAGDQPFYEYSKTEMSSFLQPGQEANLSWSVPIAKTTVAVSTIDDYCRELNIPAIDILKIDTQGADLQVLRGSKRMLEVKSVHLIRVELIFTDLYDGGADPLELILFLRQVGYALVSLYGQQHERNILMWCDALFIPRPIYG